MGKTKLLLEYDYEFLLIGIISRVPDYKLMWSLNRSLGIDLQREEDMALPAHVEKDTGLTLGFDDAIEQPKYAFFKYENEDEHISFTMVANHSKSSSLIKEEQSVDFFLIIDGLYDELDVDDLLHKIKEDKFVITAFEIDPNRLKSKQNLLFE